MIALLLLLAGCEGGGTGGTDSGGPDRCPEGMSQTFNGTATVTSMTFNGTSQFPALVPTGLYNGEPAICIADDGTGAQFILEQDGIAILYIWATDLVPGSYSLAAGEDGVQLYAETAGTLEPAEFGPSDWTTGQLVVNQAGIAGVNFGMNGSATNTSPGLTIAGNFSAR